MQAVAKQCIKEQKHSYTPTHAHIHVHVCGHVRTGGGHAAH